MNINWEDKDSIFNAFSDICKKIESMHYFEEGCDACQQFNALVDEYYANLSYEIALDTDFFIRLIKRSGRLCILVPEERFFDKELLLTLLSVGCWKTYTRNCFGSVSIVTENARDYLEYAPKEVFNDKIFVLEAIILDPGVYEYLPDDLKRDEDILNKALEHDWRVIRYIPRDVHIERSIAIKAVQNGGWNIGYLPHEYDDDLELLYIAVREDPHSFRKASDIFRKDVDLTLKMVRDERVPYDEVDDSLWQNYRFALEMFKLFGIKVLFKVDWDSGDLDERYNFAKELVGINPNSFAYLPEDVKAIDDILEGGELKKIKEKAEAECLKLKAKKTAKEKELDKRWDTFLNSLFVSRLMDIDEFLGLFFDTYWYFKNREDTLVLNVGGWHILSCLSAFRKMPLDFCPSGCLLNEFNAARCICEDLLSEINKGMPGYYSKSALVILRSCYPPAGCSNLSAEMGDYESFKYEFNVIVEEFDDYFGDWRGENYSGRYNMST